MKAGRILFITLISLMLLIITIISCGKSGTSFKEVTIGEQVWMAENLDIDKFRNGDPIPQVTTKVEMENANKNGQPAWCYYDFDEKKGGGYGKLYNWYAVNDPRGLAPEGWHVPQYYEWFELYSYLGGKNGMDRDDGNPRVGTKLISDQLERQNSAGTNESKFNALPGGQASYASFYGEGDDANWWSTSNELAIELDFKKEELIKVGEASTSDRYFLSVRCVKDYVIDEEANQEIKSEKFGNQDWMVKNLNVNKFRNGDEIPQAKNIHELQNAMVNKEPVWYYFRFDPRNSSKLGKLYNWWAIIDPRGLAPEGWVVPTAIDWLELQASFCVGDFSGSSANDFKSRFNLAGGAWWSNTLIKKSVRDSEASEELSNYALYYTDGQIGLKAMSSKKILIDDAGLYVRCVSMNITEPALSKETKIGEQIWTTTNLDLDKFRNGDEIYQAKSAEEWSKVADAKQPAWCYYAFNEELGAKYGKLYNWYAVSDSRGLAPLGYHIPTKEEWEQLRNKFYCDTDPEWSFSDFNFTWLSLKSKTDWDTYRNIDGYPFNGNGENLSGFNALPAGFLNYSKLFLVETQPDQSEGIREKALWWSASEFDNNSASIGDPLSLIWETELKKSSGLSVRCVKD
jgi:uncharacterized protein (TIGR02145 family)